MKMHVIVKAKVNIFENIFSINETSFGGGGGLISPNMLILFFVERGKLDFSRIFIPLWMFSW